MEEKAQGVDPYQQHELQSQLRKNKNTKNKLQNIKKYQKNEDFTTNLDMKFKDKK